MCLAQNHSGGKTQPFCERSGKPWIHDTARAGKLTWSHVRNQHLHVALSQTGQLEVKGAESCTCYLPRLYRWLLEAKNWFLPLDGQNLPHCLVPCGQGIHVSGMTNEDFCTLGNKGNPPSLPGFRIQAVPEAGLEEACRFLLMPPSNPIVHYRALQITCIWWALQYLTTISQPPTALKTFFSLLPWDIAEDTSGPPSCSLCRHKRADCWKPQP